MMYNLEIDRAIKAILQKKSKTVLIQLPDGLKPKAAEIADAIEKKTGAEVLIWLASCYGACDLPLGLDTMGINHVVAFGHSQFRKTPEGW